MNSYLKSWAFLVVSAIAFVCFCWFLRSLVIGLSLPSEEFAFPNFWALGGFFLLTIGGIVFAGLLSQRWYFALFPLVFPVILGSAFFLAPLHLLLVFGVPFAFLFLAVKQAIKNRLVVQFGSDIRRPMTTAYLLIFFFGSFAIAPFLDTAIRANAASLAIGFLPETVEVEGQTIDLTATLDDLIAQEIDKNLAVCQGSAECETRLRAELTDQVRQQFASSPMFAGTKVDNDTPLIELMAAKTFDEIDQHPFSVALEERNIPVSFVWGLMLFLLISPFTILFSLVTVLMLSLGFEILKIVRVFRITQQDVKQDVIR